MNYPVKTPNSNPFALDLTEGPSKALSTEINHMRQNGSWLGRLRLRKLRSREDYEYAQEALREMMAAKRRTIVAAINLAEDSARKLLLSEAARSTSAVEQDISRFTMETIRYFNEEIVAKSEAAMIAEMENILHTQALLDAKKISQTRCDEQMARIAQRTNHTITGAEEASEKLLGNIKQRFERLLASDGSAR